MKNKYALISVYDKTGVVKLAKALRKNDFQIISTGGTAAGLKKAGIKIVPIEEITQNPEAFDGRMKTISFQVESGILYDRKNKSHQQQAQKLHIPSIDMIVCNLYPFQETLQKVGVKIDELVEMIDVGGPTMVRAAAKNYRSVTVLVDPADYPQIIEELASKNQPSLLLRQRLAVKAFALTAGYDSLIHQTLAAKLLDQHELHFSLTKGSALRYGENPHQSGMFYQTAEVDKLASSSDPLQLANFKQLQGKELSFNNLLDCSAAINSLAEVADDRAACTIIKHGNPCGAALAKNITNAFNKAWAGDSLAAFGSVIAVNRNVTKGLAEAMLQDKRFFEVLLAPKVTDGAAKIFAKKKNLRVLVNPALSNPQLDQTRDVKKVRGGYLVQAADTKTLSSKDLQVVTKQKPTPAQMQAMLFAWSLCRSCKSNSIVLTKDEMLIGAGVGQQDRKRCCELAVSKSGVGAENSVAASDAFFPFADGPEILINAGVKAIIQPGGSINDRQTIDLCNQHGITMVFTDTRCFKH